MKTATELINQLDLSGRKMLEPIAKLYRDKVINDQQFTELVDHISKVNLSAYKHGYWKAIQLTKGDEMVINILGDGRTKGE